MPHAEYTEYTVSPTVERLINAAFTARSAAARHRANIALLEHRVATVLTAKQGPALDRALRTIEHLRDRADPAAGTRLASHVLSAIAERGEASLAYLQDRFDCPHSSMHGVLSALHADGQIIRVREARGAQPALWAASIGGNAA